MLVLNIIPSPDLMIVCGIIGVKVSWGGGSPRDISPWVTFSAYKFVV